MNYSVFVSVDKFWLDNISVISVRDQMIILSRTDEENTACRVWKELIFVKFLLRICVSMSVFSNGLDYKGGRKNKGGGKKIQGCQGRVYQHKRGQSFQDKTTGQRNLIIKR